MLDVKSLSPLPVASLIWQPMPGHYALSVICKATFDLAPSISALSQVQDPLREDDEHWGRDPAYSLYAPSDRVPFKPRGDVMLVGHAYAPRGAAVASLMARLVVGEVNKSIEITTERAFNREGGIHEGARFLKMPLHYERTAAGPDNPVGVRLDVPNSYGVISLPNLLPPGMVVNAPTDPVPPIGFGPIAPSWRSRAQRLGPNAAGLSARDLFQRPLPDGFDASYFNAAPWDQQVDTIRADERIVLENLHPAVPRLVTSLPGLHPRAFVELAGRNAQEITLVGDSLWIDTDRSICTLTWRGHCPIEVPTQAGRVLVVLSRPGENVTWADIDKLDRPARRQDSAPHSALQLDDDDDMRQTTMATDDAARFRAALPFARDAAYSRQPPAAAPVSSPLPAAAPPPPRVSAPLPAAAPPPPPPRFSSAGSPAPAPAAMPTPAAVPPPAPTAAPAAASLSPWASPVVTARPSPIVSPTPPASSPAPSAPPPAPAKPVEPPKPTFREYLDLLWHDPDSVRRLRAVKAWTKALTDPEDGDFIDGSTAWKPAAGAADRIDVLRILTGVKPLSGEEVVASSGSAVDESGAFSPALVVMTGELQLSFDEIESLKAYITAATPIASADKRLREAVDGAAEALKSAWPPSAPLAESFTVRIKEAFAQANRAVPAHYLEAAAERALLGQRLFQKRTILGKPRLRCLFTPSQGGSPLPVYLPESLSTQLPMFQRFRATIAAEAQAQQDQYETHPIALLALALARLLPVPGSTSTNQEKPRPAGARG